MSLFNRFRLLGYGIRLALLSLLMGYILIAVILGVDMILQETAAADVPRSWLSRVLPDVLKYVPPLLAVIAMFGRRPARRPAPPADSDGEGGEG